jgi:hypothetical protein
MTSSTHAARLRRPTQAGEPPTNSHRLTGWAPPALSGPLAVSPDTTRGADVNKLILPAAIVVVIGLAVWIIVGAISDPVTSILAIVIVFAGGGLIDGAVRMNKGLLF